jgi:hypothetical protein
MNKMTSIALTVVLFCSLSIASSAEDLFPSASVNGATGSVRMPTADVLPYRNLNIGFDIGNNSITNKQMLYYKMNVGTFQGLELGIVGGTTGNAMNEGIAREGVFINMKYSLATGNYDNPLFLAIGVENLSSYYQTDVYMVATKYLSQGPKLHFGFMGDFPGEKFRPMGMLGFDFPVAEKFLIMTDALAGESIFQLDVGIRYYMSPTFCLNISGLNVTYDETAYDKDSDEKTASKEFKDPKCFLIGLTLTNPF